MPPKAPKTLAFAGVAMALMVALVVREEASGGWRVEPPPNLDNGIGWDSDRCDIEIIEDAGANMSIREFGERFRFSRPVILRGAVDGSWPARERWTRSELLRRHGGREVKVGTSAQALVDNEGDGDRRMWLEDFLRRLRQDGRSGASRGGANRWNESE